MMVSKTVFFSLVTIAVILITTTAKPTGEEEIYQDQPPQLRMNRHGKRRSVDLQNNFEEPEYVMYDTRGIPMEDVPQNRLRLNRHGK